MKRLYDSVRWRKARAQYLVVNPLCVMCEARGRVTPATVVDHKIPHKGDYDLFWDRDNWQSLCDNDHNTIKQMQEIHGYSQACGVDGFPVDINHPWNKGK